MIAKNPLSIPMRDILIEHIDGPVPIGGKIIPGSMTEKSDLYLRGRALNNCFAREWLVPDRAVSPTSTMLTEQGRAVLCEALADWADAITKANWNLEMGGLVPERSSTTKPR